MVVGIDRKQDHVSQAILVPEEFISLLRDGRAASSSLYLA